MPKPEPLTPEHVAEASPYLVTEVFRVTSPCMDAACPQWSGVGCKAADRLIGHDHLLIHTFCAGLRAQSARSPAQALLYFSCSSFFAPPPGLLRFGGRPSGRIVGSKPSSWAVRFTQPSSPYG